MGKQGNEEGQKKPDGHFKDSEFPLKTGDFFNKCPETSKKWVLKTQPTMAKQENEEGQKIPDTHFKDL